MRSPPSPPWLCSDVHPGPIPVTVPAPPCIQQRPGGQLQVPAIPLHVDDRLGPLGHNFPTSLATQPQNPQRKQHCVTEGYPFHR